MSFEALLNTTCVLQTATRAQDASGTFIDSWADTISDIPCRLDSADGGLTSTPKMVYEARTHVLFMNEQSITVTVKSHRIKIGSTYYEIVGISEPLGFNSVHHLEISLRIVE